ncbi:MAG: hypothetical protein KDC28_13425 [Saprospiraceae bacterium]|nr:hypothetical protein [Saprospiraceae bacterium]MCB9321576.1 hypothetical protein [Lewinellaceae bacterium]
MRYTFLISVLLIFCGQVAISQGAVYTVKGGLTAGFQKWSGFGGNSALFGFHGDVQSETYEEDSPFSLYIQAGFHQRGSTLRRQRVLTVSGDHYQLPTNLFIFNNASVQVGAKQRFYDGGWFKAYYGLGIRGEYTISTNLSQYEYINQFYPIYPLDGFTLHWNYGVSLLGGMEIPFSDLIEGVLEFGFHPDLSRQYYQPALSNVVDPYNPGSLISLQERRVKNISFELSLGLRFIHKVVYID